MAREADLPRWLAGVHPVHRVPHRAVLVQGAAVCLLVLSVDLRGAIGFSSFGVLVYYLVANLSALGQPEAERRYPRPLQVVGAVACVVLVVTLPVSSVVGGAAVLLAGVGYRLLRLRLPHRVPGARLVGRDRPSAGTRGPGGSSTPRTLSNMCSTCATLGRWPAAWTGDPSGPPAGRAEPPLGGVRRYRRALPGEGGGTSLPLAPTAATAGPAPAAGGGPAGTAGTSGTSSARRHCW
jgi:hypothetical protein